MSQYKLAKSTCLNFKTISGLINGKVKDVKSSTIILICSVLDISLSQFYNSDFFNTENIEI